MLKIQNLSQLNLVIDADILDLLRLRFDQMDLDMSVSIFIVEPADSISDIDEEIGFPIITNLFDDARFPDPDFVPCSEALIPHLYITAYQQKEAGRF